MSFYNPNQSLSEWLTIQRVTGASITKLFKLRQLALYPVKRYLYNAQGAL